MLGVILNHETFTFVLEKALVIADEKGHQSMHCLGGEHLCSDCDSMAAIWALDPYPGKIVSLKEVADVLSVPLRLLFHSFSLCLSSLARRDVQRPEKGLRHAYYSHR